MLGWFIFPSPCGSKAPFLTLFPLVLTVVIQWCCHHNSFIETFLLDIGMYWINRSVFSVYIYITNPINTKPCIYQHFHDICLKEMHVIPVFLMDFLRYIHLGYPKYFQLLVVKIPYSYPSGPAPPSFCLWW